MTPIPTHFENVDSLIACPPIKGDLPAMARTVNGQ